MPRDTTGEGMTALPDSILDDRLAIVGTSGAGKTYAAKGLVERLLSTSARICIVDPLGVWYGLRVEADGKAPAFPVAIFGGRHGDLPISEAAGALIGQAVATTNASCVIDLSDGRAARPPPRPRDRRMARRAPRDATVRRAG